MKIIEGCLLYIDFMVKFIGTRFLGFAEILHRENTKDSFSPHLS